MDVEKWLEEQFRNGLGMSSLTVDQLENLIEAAIAQDREERGDLSSRLERLAEHSGISKQHQHWSWIKERSGLFGLHVCGIPKRHNPMKPLAAVDAALGEAEK